MKISQILTKNRILELLSRFSQVRAGVIGDLALDAYWYVDMTRSHLSRETPQFYRPVVSETYSPGAGGNVAQNLAALGMGQVKVFSVVGEEPWGKLLQAELLRRNIRTQGLLTHPGRRTIAYIKPILMGYDSRQEDARLDFENTLPLAPQAEEQLLALFEEQLADLEAVLIADQLEENGILTSRVRQRLVELAQIHSRTVFLVDSRQRISLYQGMVMKPNRMEALAAWKPEIDPRQASHADLEEAVQHMARQSGRPVFLTLGEEGVLVCTSNEQRYVTAAPVRPPLDVVGAGDAFFAALAASLAAGGNAWEAGAIANLAAAVTVEKLNQTGTATPAEILARFDLANSPQ